MKLLKDHITDICLLNRKKHNRNLLNAIRGLFPRVKGLMNVIDSRNLPSTLDLRHEFIQSFIQRYHDSYDYIFNMIEDDKIAFDKDIHIVLKTNFNVEMKTDLNELWERYVHTLENGLSVKNDNSEFLLDIMYELISELELKLEGYSPSITGNAGNGIKNTGYIISDDKIMELKSIQNSPLDLTGLIRMCEEINIAYQNKCWYSVGALTRNIMDHIPPIFGHKDFKEFASQISETSFRKTMKALLDFGKNIFDDLIHSQIKKKISLPTKEQVYFAPALNMLIGKIIEHLGSGKDKE